MRVDAHNKEDFFTISGPFESGLRKLDSLIRKAAPNLKPELFQTSTMTMMAYGVTPYKYPSGKTGEWPLIAIAPQKNYAALYVCGLKNGQYYAEIYKDSLGKVSCGKSCIRFKKSEDLNYETVEEIVKDISERVSQGETVFGI